MISNLGGKLLWTGATLILADSLWALADVPMVDILGSIIMVIGIILYWARR